LTFRQYSYFITIGALEWKQQWLSCHIMFQKPKRFGALREIQAAALFGRLTHWKRMQERGISAPDIEHALTNGQVVLSEVKRDDVWRVIGKDIDGNRLTIEVVVLGNTIKIVTAFVSPRR
jgi:Domain of unknown function (DUF4258)